MDSTEDPKRPMVSVMLIVRNGGDYLAPQIDSILAQTYSNLELIICDDCSTDRTPQIAQEYMRRDPRVRYARNETNLRVSLTFERNCHLCRGGFIAPSDADDFWLPRKLEAQVDYLLAHPKAQMVFADDMIVSEDLSVKLGSFQRKIGNHSRGGEISTNRLLVRNYVPFHICCFRRAVLPRLLPMPGQSVFMYDNWACLVCSLSAPVGYINECLVLYRQHQSNMVGAGVRDALFYLKQLNDAAFVRHYVLDKSCQMSIHARLMGMDPCKSAENALREKIANQKALFAAMQSANFGEFVSRMAKAAWCIFKTSQKYHFKQWLFLALSWGAIKRAKLQNQFAEGCCIGTP
ncbi:MAG: glycosyltransferase [Limisphaerales bacterium]